MESGDESVIDPDAIPDAVRSYNVDIPDGRPCFSQVNSPNSSNACKRRQRDRQTDIQDAD